MVQSSTFKTQILLSDYSYRRDIEHRVLISNLSVFEVDVLKEILHETLTIHIDQLADNLGVSQKKLIPVLDSLSRTKLFKRNDQILHVDKDLRKYYESQMEKFEVDFIPNLEFLQSMLNNVPVHVLLLWYTIPRSSDNIFASIVEQCLLTPKTYRSYLHELNFDDPVMHSIIQDLYKAPDYRLYSKEIIAKYQLTREKFEEYLLLLEYHLVCCLSYNKEGDEWQEVVTPFSEWLEYLRFEKRSQPNVLKNPETVKVACESDFGFVEDLTTVIKTCQKSKNLEEEIANLNLTSPVHIKALEYKLFQLDFVKKSGKSIVPTERGLLWAAKSLQDRVSSLAVDPKNRISSYENSPLWNIRNVHLVEKTMRKLKPYEWVNLEEFLSGISVPIGNKDSIRLEKIGKKWKYILPEYSLDELEFFARIIMERCFELGLTKVGQQKGEPCFCLTQFGYHFIH